MSLCRVDGCTRAAQRGYRRCTACRRAQRMVGVRAREAAQGHRVCASAGCTRRAQPDRRLCHVCRNGGRAQLLEVKRGYRARKAKREGKQYRTIDVEQRRAINQQRTETRRLQNARRALARQLLRVLDFKLWELGTSRAAMEFRSRYETDPSFKRRQQQRRKTNNHSFRQAMSRGPMSARETSELLILARSCAYCGRALVGLNRAIDHLIPLSRGGEHERSNVVIACKSCNSRKKCRTPLEWVFGVSISRDGVAKVAR